MIKEESAGSYGSWVPDELQQGADE